METTAKLVPEIIELQPEFAALRRELHQHPELGFEEQRTSEQVARLLTSWGYDVCRGLGGTGVVGTLRQGNSPRSVGIRADMDALPIHETSGLPHASTVEGKMHACGHDGHTATLLCAAKYLAATRRFDGTLNLIFQPAEELLGGARAMLEDGLLERFPCDSLFALHTAPGMPLGNLLISEGPLTASSDRVTITLHGKGGHGAMPHKTCDPVVAAATLVLALQTIVSRNIPASEVAVVTVGAMQAGSAANVIPDDAQLRLSIRASNAVIRDMLEQRIRQITDGIAAAHGARAEICYERLVPVLVNECEATRRIAAVAADLIGHERILTRVPGGFLGSEDFAWMLEARPGCYVALGNGNQGAHGCSVHNPGFDFNDQAIAYGASLWARLVESVLAR
ncbi:M20 aminoacylase family protein [Pseudomonas xanthosomatis]|uniref:M20 aminoacylase family protein n=1 Tax=Pseudomonas xanthosomatis TaxID=2842356 RepID=UPI0035150EA0